MGLFDLLSRARRSRSGQASTPLEQELPLCVERLETRNLLDASGSLLAGILYVTGTPGRDRIDLSLDAATSQLVLRDSGKEVGRFISVNVNAIAVLAGDGNQRVQIASDVTQPAVVQAGHGDTILQAGGGPTTLIAGDGNDKLIGGAAPSTLIGGSGNDVLVSKSGQDILNVGSGPTKLFVRGNDVLVGVKPTDQVFGQLNSNFAAPALPPDPPATLSTTDVATILQRAAAATPSDDAIVAIMDRGGHILGVRVESNVSPVITGDPGNLTFAIDGALAEARTAAFFANDQAPLTSRTIQFISQSTITEREVNSNPNIADPNSTLRGPGFVAPVEIGGHFPPGVMFTPQVDLFNIEASNRDSSEDLLPGRGRFNVPAAFIPSTIPPDEQLVAPDSYGVVTGLLPGARGRGIGTLPGGVPIYKDGQVVGGIGVFFPGTTGFATAENSRLSATFDPTKPDRSLEAELIAFTAAGGSPTASSPLRPAGSFDFRGPIGAAPALPSNFGIPDGRIDLVGITLDIFGPGGRNGPDVLASEANQVHFGTGNPASGVNVPVDKTSDTLLPGAPVPDGWLVTPHDGTTLTAAQVTQIIDQGIAQANVTRAAIRLPLDSLTKMVFAVTDTETGEVLGLYRMPDATVFSLDIAVGKARNVAYYDNAAQLQPIDQLPGVPAGVAFTNRTFRYLAEPFFPEGVDTKPPGPFSILNVGGVDPTTGLQVGPPLPASAFDANIVGHDAFNPGTNFHDPFNKSFQNGIIFFPGSSPLYQGNQITGGFGVSGDGVDQDDVITFFGQIGFGTPLTVPRADQIFFRGVRLPYQFFNRNPIEPV
jgi:uncharacterized protein GlcG (DUF336 family)